MSITVLVSYGAVFLSSGIFLLQKLIDCYYWWGGWDGRNTYLALFAIDGFFTIDIMH
jgi:hypothetical protein